MQKGKVVEFYDLKYSLKANVPHETMPLYPQMNVMRQCLSQDSCPFKFIKNRTSVARNYPEWNMSGYQTFARRERVK